MEQQSKLKYAEGKYEGGSQEQGFDPDLLRAAIRFNSIFLGLTFGLSAAGVMFGATHASLSYWGDDAGGFLGLLGIFFPGYSVTSGGAWIGAFWAFLFAFIGGTITYRIYGRLLGERISAGVGDNPGVANPFLNPSTLRIHSMPLGLSLGGAIGGSLFLSTSWLIIRGTADSSVHANLLSNYLPGYDTSYAGAALGALELFGFVWLCCVLLAWVYNTIAERRAS